MELNGFENGGVEEEEGLSFVDTIVSAYGFALCTGTNRDKRVASLPKTRPTQLGSSSQCFFTSSLEVRVEVLERSSTEAQG